MYRAEVIFRSSERRQQESFEEETLAALKHRLRRLMYSGARIWCYEILKDGEVIDYREFPN